MGCDSRIEFGVVRSVCACAECSRFCRFMPGHLLPSDLARLTEGITAIFSWAEKNLLASPGAVVMDTATREVYNIHTLVPATKIDGSCIHLTDDGRCNIHAKAPFGCAFFSCTDGDDKLAAKGLLAIAEDNGLYAMVWQYLASKGKVQLSPKELRERIKC